MGSPSNVFGNEPEPDGTWSSVPGNQSFWINVAGARALVDFFVSPDAQAVIGEFGRGRFGTPLFIANTVESRP